MSGLTYILLVYEEILGYKDSDKSTLSPNYKIVAAIALIFVLVWNQTTTDICGFHTEVIQLILVILCRLVYVAFQIGYVMLRSMENLAK